MNLDPVLELIQERTGMDPATLGAHAVRAAIRARQRAAGIDDVHLYAVRVAQDQAEYTALISEVVVPETWFFRGGDLFYYLAEHVRATLLSRQGPAAEPFRVLSLPCSSGEEPYSLAIALAELDLSPSRCVILGIDVSPRQVELARRGVYGELSFRQLPAALRQRYFRPTGRPIADEPAAWEVDPRLREFVRFQVGNVLDEGLLRFERPFDLVFCRNLFIYFSLAARQRALSNLHRLLQPQGLLCLGHADTLGRDEGRFERFGPGAHFLYCRAERKEESRKGAAPLPAPAAPRPPAARRPAPPQPAAARPLPPRPAPAPAPEPEPTLADLIARARRRANSGEYDEAQAVCRSAHERFGPNADLYSLMGVIHQAKEERGPAMQAFTKALYLDPVHREALVHLMLLHQVQGDVRQAAVLRSRIGRLPPETGEAS